MEYAGAIELNPAFTYNEIGYVRRLAGHDEPGLGMAWAPSRNGALLRPRKDAGVEALLESLRYLIATMARPGRFRGLVAVYDGDSGEMFGITAAGGRVTVRVLRNPGPLGPTPRSNVIDLSSRRRATSRRIV